MRFLVKQAIVGVSLLFFVICNAGYSAADGRSVTAYCVGDAYSGPGVEVLTDPIGVHEKLYHIERLTAGSYRIDVASIRNGPPVLSFILNSSLPSHSFYASNTIHWITCFALAPESGADNSRTAPSSALEKLRAKREQRRMEDSVRARDAERTISQRGRAMQACRAAGRCAPDKALQGHGAIRTPEGTFPLSPSPTCNGINC